MDKIDRNSSSSSDVTFVKCNVRSMLFVNDLALLSSNKSDLQYAIDRFPDACLDATSKSCRQRGRVVKVPCSLSTWLGLKLTRVILLCPFERHFTPLSPAW